MAAAWRAGVRVAGRVSDPATLLETEAALEPETSLSTEQPRRNARSENNLKFDTIRRPCVIGVLESFSNETNSPKENARARKKLLRDTKNLEI